MFYVYVLKNLEGRLYIGQTDDLEERLARHQTDRAGWTRLRGPWELVHYETFTTRGEAMARERRLKCGKANKELRERLAGVQSVERVLQPKD